jgi:nitrile hydratase accessory protein
VSDTTLPIAGPAAPPRTNGELVFAAPWESRLFGMTLALIERGAFAWRDFQKELVAAIHAWESAAAPSAEYHYYERWQEALERLLERTAICSHQDLESRAEAFAARPPGHDHDHDHDHDH